MRRGFGRMDIRLWRVGMHGMLPFAKCAPNGGTQMHYRYGQKAGATVWGVSAAVKDAVGICAHIRICNAETLCGCEECSKMGHAGPPLLAARHFLTSERVS